jgi:hypothetical protein
MVRGGYAAPILSFFSQGFPDEFLQLVQAVKNGYAYFFRVELNIEYLLECEEKPHAIDGIEADVKCQVFRILPIGRLFFNQQRYCRHYFLSHSAVIVDKCTE